MVNLIALMLVVLLVAMLTKRRFELALPPVVLGLMAVLSILAVFGALSLIDTISIIVIILVALTAAVALLTKRTSLSGIIHGFTTKCLTPCLICLICILAYFWYACRPMTVWWRDDLFHWGLEAKSLWYFDGFVDGARHLNPRFGNYMPGISLIQWWVMRVVGECNERAMYFALFGFYAVFTLPLFSRAGGTWKKWYLIPAIIVVGILLPCWGSTFSYTTLCVDTALSLCFGYTLVTIFRETAEGRDISTFGLVCIGLGMFGMIWLKHIGVLFALFAAVFMLVRHRRPNVRMIACALAPIAAMCAWLLYCRRMGLDSYNSSGIITTLEQMIKGEYQLPINADGILPSLLSALAAKYSGEVSLNTSPWLPVPVLVWLVLNAVAPVFLAKDKKRGLRISLYIAAATLFYLAMLYVSFFTTFYHETDVYTGALSHNMVMLLERYLPPLLLGFGMLVLDMAFAAPSLKPRAGNRLRPMLAATVFTALFVVSTNMPLMYEVMLPDVYYQNDRSIGSELLTRDREYWATDLEEYPDAVILVDMKTTNDYLKDLRYAFAPTRFVVAEPENLASVEALTDFIIASHVTHMVFYYENDALYDLLIEFNNEYGIYDRVLYDVKLDEGAILLEEIY